jgi:hypothetical protein
MSFRIYLELDGAINAPRAADLWGLKSFDSIDFGGYTFIWSTSAVAELVTLCEDFGAEIVWLTGWSEDIPVLARLLGFGHIGAEGRVLEEIGIGSTPFEKADVLLQDVMDNPLSGDGWIWLDPVSDDVLQSSAYVHRMLVDGGGGFVPPLSEVVGITPSLVRYLRGELSSGKMRKTSKGTEGGNSSGDSNFGEGGERWT